jgi:hypothetical protein
MSIYRQGEADTIASLDQTLLIKQIAHLKPSVFNQVLAEIETLIRQP